MQRYIKYSKELRDENYIPAEELISNISLKKMLDVVDNLKANEIPSFLKNTLLIPISDATIEKYGTYRKLRNDIAHGEAPNITLRKVKEANKFLRNFAGQIDDFLTTHYKKPRNYQV